MSRRAVYLLFLVYVAADLANPMMPGAFQLVDGTINAVEVVAARAHLLAAPVLTPTPAPEVQLRPAAEPPVPRAAPVGRAPRVPTARRALARSTAPPAPADDH